MLRLRLGPPRVLDTHNRDLWDSCAMGAAYKKFAPETSMQGVGTVAAPSSKFRQSLRQRVCAKASEPTDEGRCTLGGRQTAT